MTLQSDKNSNQNSFEMLLEMSEEEEEVEDSNIEVENSDIEVEESQEADSDSDCEETHFDTGNIFRNEKVGESMIWKNNGRSFNPIQTRFLGAVHTREGIIILTVTFLNYCIILLFVFFPFFFT